MAEVGRPTKYDPAFIDKVDEYLEQCQDEEDEFHKTRGEKSDTYDRLIKPKLPTMYGFAKYIGVALSSVKLWAIDYPEFSAALGKIMEEQQDRLVTKGLSGDYNPTIAKLVLSANHGLREGSDITSNGNEIKIGFDSSFDKK